MLWHSSVKVVVLSKSLQQITCEVSLPDHTLPIIVTIFYAANCKNLRSALWAELQSLASSSFIAGQLWLVMGDFNQSLHPQEHSSTNLWMWISKCGEFGQCLMQAELEDLNSRGNSFTWWNKRKATPIAKKLDRILVNNAWYNRFPSSIAYFQDPDFSDHACSTVSLNPATKKKKRPFKFFNYLLQNPDFLPTIMHEWFSINVRGSAMFRLAEKLRIIKNCIRSVGKIILI